MRGKPLRIAICGAGLVGSYLYRLLSQAGLGTVTLFERPEPPSTACGIRPCAWGTPAGVEGLLSFSALDPAKYVLQTVDAIVMNGVEVRAKALVIDKPRLIADLHKGANILTTPLQINEFDRIIDCTGYNRAFLPEIGNDIIGNCIQYRISCTEKKQFAVDISNQGYAWCIPITGDQYHIGAGSISISPQKMLQRLGWLGDSSPICRCAGKARLTAPYFSRPFVSLTGNGLCQIWGAGEALGCVAPLAGEGIVPGMESARILVNNWENPQAYENAILKEFAWMKAERMVLDKALQGKRLGLLDARVFVKSTQRFKLNLDYRRSLSLLRSINRIDA